MNSNTLRFGVFRTLAFCGVLVAGAWAGKAAAFTPTPIDAALGAALRAEALAAFKAETAAELKRSAAAQLERDLVRGLAAVDPATREDLITKAAAAASIAPRGFGLVAPALFVDHME